MASSSRPITYRMRSDNRFLVDPSAPQMRRERESAWVSRSYPPSAPTSPIMTSPPSPVLHPEHPPRSQTPDNWNLSSPNASEMPSPMRRALMPMLSLAREAKEETLGDRSSPRDTRAEDVPPSRRSLSKPRSSPASPPQSRSSQQQQSYRKHRSPRVDSESDPEDGGAPRSWRSTPADRDRDRSPPRTPPPSVPLHPSGARTSPRRQKSKVKRSSVAHRRLMESAALSSDSGIAGSPLCQSPLVALPLPDTLPSASEFERPFFPPERPPRSHQRASPIPSPSGSPLALQPVSPRAERGALQLEQGPPSREEQQRETALQMEEQAHQQRTTSAEEQYRPSSPERSRRSDSFNSSVPVPLSPGSTLAQTRPVSPSEEARSSSPKASFKPHQQTSAKPVEEPAVRHTLFYMEDEMITLRVENCLFRVHRYFLERDSTFFKDFFQRTVTGTGMGKTDDTAIRLQEVSRREFECLLHFLYHGASSAQNDSILNLVLLLSTSSALSFPAARTHAIGALDRASPPLDPVERVFLAEKYDIPAWLRPAYVELCSRAHPLEDAEAEVLGLQTTARLARAREAVLEEKVQEWRRAVERAQSGEGTVTKEDMEVREAKLVERVVDEIFASGR
ncbi:hypothetical protein C8Q77DRAFT_1194732 [Trametes polyzona]|nr:hypothetical protein C8Q77DRAFT_1194732 [Trametes polyzona]